MSLILAFLIVVAGGHRYKWKWTGFPEKTFWDWLQLLLIPVALAGAALWFSDLQDVQEGLRADRRAQIDRQREDQRAEVDRELAADAQREQTLQNYLSGMSQLMIERKLRASKKGSEIRIVGRTRTLSTLRRLDGERKGLLVRFLAEAGLIHIGDPIVNLQRADLTHAELKSANLKGANFAGADLSEANLQSATLRRSSLRSVEGNKLNLSRADLRDAILDKGRFGESNLDGANLSGASLTDAKFESATFRKTIMADGSRHK